MATDRWGGDPRGDQETPVATAHRAPCERALVTGGSSGIGAAFARELARRGWDLVLTARSDERLAELGSSLESAHGVVVETLSADLGRDDGLASVRARASAGDIGFLVNSAGFGLAGGFAEREPERHAQMLAVHVSAPVGLARAVLPGMLARGQGAIINVSSVAAFASTGGHPMYCATKLFLNGFSRHLQEEVHARGIRVQALCPGYTRTGFHETDEYADFRRERVPSWLWMSPEQVVTASLRALGGRRVVVIPGLANRVISRVCRGPTAFLLTGVRRWVRGR